MSRRTSTRRYNGERRQKPWHQLAQAGGDRFHRACGSTRTFSSSMRARPASASVQTHARSACVRAPRCRHPHRTRVHASAVGIAAGPNTVWAKCPATRPRCRSICSASTSQFGIPSQREPLARRLSAGSCVRLFVRPFLQSVLQATAGSDTRRQIPTRSRGQQALTHQLGQHDVAARVVAGAGRCRRAGAERPAR